eukprot:CAMPEP_0198541014 /NCGR_PEP_ID=MMETSP1462-20131121/53520_1 /TAXON_ID=1333877 /ORGANISM="Brandtodinium nutriculum, Strain RCC3387" /LENGTH=156 /DNA_ID=CAMNT_0044271157 /DNA_START=49 /DNA_END=519 /DNA_ORIENTATION=-
MALRLLIVSVAAAFPPPSVMTTGSSFVKSVTVEPSFTEALIKVTQSLDAAKKLLETCEEELRRQAEDQTKKDIAFLAAQRDRDTHRAIVPLLRGEVTQSLDAEKKLLETFEEELRRQAEDQTEKDIAFLAALRDRDTHRDTVQLLRGEVHALLKHV